ncbi:hypothetical protein ACW5W4_16890 [Aeromonas crassostreae]
MKYIHFAIQFMTKIPNKGDGDPAFMSGQNQIAPYCHPSGLLGVNHPLMTLTGLQVIAPVLHSYLFIVIPQGCSVRPKYAYGEPKNSH